MKLSIVLTTYNGEMYIKELLDSIRNQTRPADEVIIVDDFSVDGTNKIVNQYIKKYNLVNWLHYKNEINFGWKKNFMYAIKKATGDVICTCDQDDVWYKYKLEVIEKVMDIHQEILLLASEYDLKYREVNGIRDSWIDKIERNKFSEKFTSVQLPGCTFAFRRELFLEAETMWFDNSPHDALLWRLANIKDSLYCLRVPLIYYRRHENTATGHEIKKIDTRIKDIAYYQEVFDCFSEYLNKDKEVNNHDYKAEVIDNCKKWSSLRMRMYVEKNIAIWFYLFKFIKYYYNVRAYFADLYILLKKNK